VIHDASKSAAGDVHGAAPGLMLVDLYNADPIRTGSRRPACIAEAEFDTARTVRIGSAGQGDMSADATGIDNQGGPGDLVQAEAEGNGSGAEAAHSIAVCLQIQHQSHAVAILLWDGIGLLSVRSS
jgi:hypothetical protein